MSAVDRRSDEELVAVCNRGSGEEAARAFESLYRRHRDFVLRVARRFTHDRELALDALQETFTYLLGKFPPSGDGLMLTARLTTLLYPVARNSAITAMRRLRREPTVDDTVLANVPDESPPPGEPIDAALAELSAERREVVVLRFVDDLSLEEIALVLDIPLGTVKSRLHLAIKQLRDDNRIKDLFEP